MVKLAVHLENGQRVYFNEENVITVVAAAPSPVTTLTAIFGLCLASGCGAKHLLCTDVSGYYTLDQHKKSWVRRKRGTRITPNGEEMFETPAIGRVYAVSPKQGDFFHGAPSDIC
ncbi:hypothetical protein ElyMa_000948500 [Elysia marginata]|uniref:Uncharacterized protein n=1 Tax=Elysia marginata TaxID=1093978 RepID=A0AAV4HD17_9GAST|nr:hypothetical protein ElyMa_000948500 [Elysia marginata]